MNTETTTKIIQYLSEAHATELALTRTLQAHVAMTPRGSYRSLLERHLSETQEQARAIEARLGDLGEGRNLLESTWDATLVLAQGIVGQVLALSKGPIDVLRGAGGEEKLLKNAKDECATEALEIATYDALEQLARRVGDTRTAELAARHRGQEERMLADLRKAIPGLVDAVVGAELRGGGSYDVQKTGAADNVRDIARGTQRRAGHARDAVADVVEEAGDRVEEAGEAIQGSANGGAPPWRGYDGQSAAEVRRRVARASRPQVERVRAYERSHKDRATVLRAAEQKLNG